MKAIIFDIDGTLVDSVDLHARAWWEAFEHFAVQTKLIDVRNQIGKGGDKLMPTFLSQKQLDDFGKELEEWRGKHFKSNYINKVRAFHDSHALLVKTKQSGILMAAGSSAKQDELDHYLELLNANELFDVATSADDVDESKPDPDIFEIALKKLKTNFDDTIVIGDSPYDAIAARRAGLDTIGFLCGGFSEEALIEAGAIKIYAGPGDLLEQFAKSPIIKGFALKS